MPVFLLIGKNLLNMIVQNLYIDKYKWTVTAYYAVTRYYVEEIMENLERLCSEDNYLEEAFSNLKRNSLDSGLTYSNFRKRESVLVVALASSAEQFHRALMHEARHLQSHIASVYGINEKSEEVCYLLDDIVGKMHKVTAPLICECCRSKKSKHHGKN